MTEKNKKLFNTKARTIIQELNKSRRGLTIYEISKKTEIAWVTVKKYVKYLKKKGVIKEIIEDGKKKEKIKE